MTLQIKTTQLIIEALSQQHLHKLFCCKNVKSISLQAFRCYSNKQLPKQYGQLKKRQGDHIIIRKKKLQTPRMLPALAKRRGGGLGYPLLIAAFGFTVMFIYDYFYLILTPDPEVEKNREKINSPPVPLPQNLGDLMEKDNEFRRYTVRGTYDHERELFIGPCPDNTLETTADKGVHVVTPFKLADRKETILINRGHVPWKYMPHQKRVKGQISGEVEIVGVNRLQEEKKSKLFWIVEEESCIPNRDIKLLSHLAETEPVFLDADMNATVPGGPKAGQTRFDKNKEFNARMVNWFLGMFFSYYAYCRFYKNPKIAPKHKDILNKFITDK